MLLNPRLHTSDGLQGVLGFREDTVGAELFGIRRQLRYRPAGEKNYERVRVTEKPLPAEPEE